MKFLLVYPPSGGRLSVGPHLKRAIEECGYQVEVFDFSKTIPICLSKIRMKDQDLAFDMAQRLLIKKALETKPDIFLDIMLAANKETINFFRNKGIITCFWFLEDGFFLYILIGGRAQLWDLISSFISSQADLPKR